MCLLKVFRHNALRKLVIQTAKINDELVSRLDICVGALKDLKQNNNHTIEEEMWRIDAALEEAERSDA